MAVPTTAFRMPSRHHPYAPKFDGTPTLLDIFFDDVDQLAKACNISEAEKIAWTIRYSPIEDRELWEFYAEGYTWQNFKAVIRTYYPGSDRARLYSLNNLKSLTESYTSKPMETTDNFAKYYREFCKIAYFLKSKDRISDRETSTYLIQGLHSGFRGRVLEQLRAESPTHHPDDPYKVSRIYSAALFILSCNHDIAESYGEQAPADIESVPNQFNAATPPAMMDILAAEVSKIISASTSQPQEPAQTGAYLFPASQYQVSRQPRTARCVFCSELSHHLRDCPLAEGYVKSGRCKRNFEGQIILPDGDIIDRQAWNERNLKKCIDRWHEQQAPVNLMDYPESKASTGESNDTYLPSQFQYSWLKDDIVDQVHVDTSAIRQQRIESEIFQSFTISQVEEVKSTKYTSKHDDERDITSEPIVKYPATSVGAPMINNHAAAKIDAQIVREPAASASITRPASHILTRSIIEDMCAARRLPAPGNRDHAPKVRNSELENIGHNMALGDNKATASASVIAQQLRTREEHTRAMSSLRDPRGLSDEMTQRRRALAENPMVSYTRGSPVDATERALSQQYLEDQECSSAALIAPSDSQTAEASRRTIPYPRGFVKCVAVIPPSKSLKSKNVRLIPGLIDAKQDAEFNLCNEVVKRSRALTENLTAPFTRVSPIETPVQEKLPTQVIQQNDLEERKRSLVARVSTDMQDTGPPGRIGNQYLYPREWDNRMMERRRTGYARSARQQEIGLTDHLRYEGPTVHTVIQLSTAGYDERTPKAQRVESDQVHGSPASMDDKRHMIPHSIISQSHTREALATCIGDNIEVKQLSRALGEDSAAPCKHESKIKNGAFENSHVVVSQCQKPYQDSSTSLGILPAQYNQRHEAASPRPSPYWQELTDRQPARIQRQYSHRTNVSWRQDNAPQNGYSEIRSGRHRRTANHLRRCREPQKCNAVIYTKSLNIPTCGARRRNADA